MSALRRSLATAALLLLAAGPARAQGFHAVYARTASDVVAVGDNGDTYRTLNGGLDWTERAIGPNTNALRAVAGSGLSVVIAGDAGVIWSSTDAGGNWASTTVGGAPQLRGAACASDSVWVVVGAAGTIARTVDAGATWSPVASGTGQVLNAVTFATATHGWAAGDAGTLLETTDAGASWTPAPVVSPNAFTAVAQAGAVVWVVGTEGTAFRSVDGGASFAPYRLKLDARADVRGVAMVSADTLWLTGGGGFVRGTVDGGATWTFAVHALHAPATAIAARRGGGVWVTNAKNRLVLSTANGGTTWRLPTGATFSRSWGTTPKHPNSGQVRGSTMALNPVFKNTIYCGMDSVVVRSRNDGDTWAVIDTFPTGYKKCNAFVVSAKDSNTWLAAISGNTVFDRVYRTANAGATWTPVVTHDFGEYGIPLEVDPDHPDTVYFGGENSANGTPHSPLYRSFDFGVTWDSIPTAVFRSPCDLVVVPDTTGIIVVGDGVTGLGRGRFLKSTNGGLTFTVQDSVSSSELPGLASSRLRRNVIIGTSWSTSGVFRSNDLGSTYSLVAPTFQAWGIDVAKDDPNCVIFGQFSTPFQAMLSVDGGTTYATIAPPSGFNNNYSFYIRDRATIFAEQSSGIWKLQFTYGYTPAAASQSLSWVSPLGGESWAGGSTHAITWNAAGIAVARIEYRRAPGEPWQPVALVEGAAGSYAWQVPADGTSQAKLRISDLWDGAPLDSTGAFTIPGPHEIVTPGALDFGTHGAGTSTVLPLTIRNTGTSTLMVGPIATGTPTYAAGRTTLTLAPGAQDTVGVWFLPTAGRTFPDTVTIASNDAGAGTVRIPVTGEGLGPTVAVLAPNGGESWTGGTTQDVTWTSEYLSTVDLAYRVAPDSAWVTIAAGVPATPATYAWSVPLVPTTAAAVRVSGPALSAVDTSDAPFTIVAPRLAAPDSLRLPDGQAGYVVFDPLPLANTGSATLTISAIATSNARFWVGRTSLVLAPGESDTITVGWSPAADGPDSALVLVTSDAAGSPRAVPVFGTGVVSLAAGDAGPVAFALAQNRPNPFARATSIAYALPRATDVTLDVFDLRGQRVARLVDGRQAPGRHEVRFGTGARDAAGAVVGRLAAGVYFVRLQAGAQAATRKMLLVR